jgi:hypothetical protein
MVFLLASIIFLASIIISGQDFKDEDSCWVIKSKTGPIFIKQQGTKAELLIVKGVTEMEVKRVENTLLNKRNVQAIKKTIINQKTNFSLKQYHATFIHRFPFNWNSNSENLNRLEDTRILVMERNPSVGFWEEVGNKMPNLKKMIFLRGTYLSDKNLAIAESLGIQIFYLDEIGYFRF